ncbi:asparaginase [Paraurantiacibacter namhicola]|uniref:L-asparaginase n=1 Tax=Paraurantiacibacter namhicola TaxID=645517 RepID=A0A1C7D7X0_9SPHN|nr:asparaginase [Paraurantiacibacter namhicola]ANU07393.1 L-asparaginase [Paraurantiacibacter namhicola]
MAQGTIRILATGGTIAGRGQSATGRAYRSGQIGIEQLLAEARAAGVTGPIEARQVASLGSQDIGPREWAALHAECLAAMADADVRGVVITHGTDTAEETAFLLDLTLPTTKPVVLAGAMRPADALGSDGMRNLANALAIACDAKAAGRGVLLAMGDHVFAARDVRKARTQGTGAFAGFPRGPVGHASPSGVDWFGPAGRTGEDARFAFPEAMPRVDVIHAHAGMDAGIVDAVLQGGAQGLVLAGMGQGNAPGPVLQALAGAAARGMPVLRASRVDEGLVERNVEVDDDALGLVAARDLGPAKARILLCVLIESGVTQAGEIQSVIDGLK